jgi:hypothetical protein
MFALSFVLSLDIVERDLSPVESLRQRLVLGTRKVLHHHLHA